MVLIVQSSTRGMGLYVTVAWVCLSNAANGKTLEEKYSLFVKNTL